MKDRELANQIYARLAKSLRPEPVPEAAGVQAILDSSVNPQAASSRHKILLIRDCSMKSKQAAPSTGFIGNRESFCRFKFAGNRAGEGLIRAVKNSCQRLSLPGVLLRMIPMTRSVSS